MVCLWLCGSYEVKSRKGLIRVKCEAQGGTVRNVEITGDFFMYPEDSLWIIQDSLKGIEVTRDAIKGRLAEVFKEHGVQLAGSTIDDFAEAIYCACSGECGE
jgi:lipoate-protein ligase A